MAQKKPVIETDGRKRILLVDDHAVVRFGIAQLINRQPDLVVCGEEEDASRALDSITKLKPDLVIADISLKDSSGLELMRNIKAQFPGLPVLVVSGHDETVYAEIAFRAVNERLQQIGASHVAITTASQETPCATLTVGVHASACPAGTT